MTNEERILEELRQHGPRDDDELSQRLGIRPRQQVNQICRRLEARGRLQRRLGPRGKLVNSVPAPGEAAPLDSAPRRDGKLNLPLEPERPKRHKIASTAALTNQIPAPDEVGSTLFIIPCSGKKRAGGLPKLQGPHLADELPSSLSSRLWEARQQVAKSSPVDEQTLIPASSRYAGAFYTSVGEGLQRAVQGGSAILVISGAYGLVRADEPIGFYNHRFDLRDWPRGLLEDVISAYAQVRKAVRVRAFLSASTDYRKLVSRVAWRRTGVRDAVICSPRGNRGGAMVTSPRAAGEAFQAQLTGQLDPAWLSSDGLSITTETLV